MDSFGLSPKPVQENVAIFTGFSAANGVTWQTWRKPPNIHFVSFFLLGGGGNGGTGSIGAAGVSSGGGGGGSSGQTPACIPAYMLPDNVYLSIGLNSVNSYVSVLPSTVVNNVFLVANAGGNGGNASGGTPGAAGVAGVVSGSGMPLGYFFHSPLAGQNGIAGGSTNLTIPQTGLRVTGGTGGANMPSSGAGLTGGSFTVPAQPSYFPPHPGGSGGSSTTTPPLIGTSGSAIGNTGGYWYGGTGGGSTHATATGAGLAQARGGDGSFGCGGGGMGAALTGSAAATTSSGGPGLCVISWW